MKAKNTKQQFSTFTDISKLDDLVYINIKNVLIEYCSLERLNMMELKRILKRLIK